VSALLGCLGVSANLATRWLLVDMPAVSKAAVGWRVRERSPAFLTVS